MIRVEPYDAVHMKVFAEPGIINEIRDRFQFQVPNAKHNPKFKMGIWDGIINLYKMKTKTLYRGLYDELVTFANDHNYEINSPFSRDNVTREELQSFMSKVANKSERDYQLDSILEMINSTRGLLLSPTASGKSLILYGLTRWYNTRTLIVVPTLGLVGQMYGDFADYVNDDWNVEDNISTIVGGSKKDNLKPVTISTWQSIHRMDSDWFEQFDMIIVDECHHASSSSLIKIMEAAKNCHLRFGTTGTLDGLEINELTIVGLFGKIIRFTSSKELIESGHLAKIKIYSYLLKYSKDTISLRGKTYDSEVKLLISHKRRNSFIAKLASRLKGNVLIFYQYVDKHGEVLYNTLIDELKNIEIDRPVYFIHGGVSAKEREHIRHKVDNSDNSIIVASFGTTSTGTNIVNLNHIMFASPSKSRIRVLQSIGRGLRKSAKKDEVVLHDFADDLSKGKKRNYTYSHFIQRLKMYNEEGFPYTIKEIELEK